MQNEEMSLRSAFLFAGLHSTPEALMPDDERLKALAMQWKRAAPALRAQRHRDIRKQNNASAIQAFDSYFREAMKKKRPSSTSGFVQMYQVLMRQQKAQRDARPV